MRGRQQQDLEAFGNYLLIERSLSVQTSAAYRRDVQSLTDYLDKNCNGIAPENADLQTLRDFLYTKRDASAASQARLVSGIRAYYRYLLLELFDFHDIFYKEEHLLRLMTEFFYHSHTDITELHKRVLSNLSAQTMSVSEKWLQKIMAK